MDQFELLKKKAGDMSLVLEIADHLADEVKKFQADPTSEPKKDSAFRYARAYLAVRKEFSETLPGRLKEQISHPNEPLRVTGVNNA